MKSTTRQRGNLYLVLFNYNTLAPFCQVVETILQKRSFLLKNKIKK